MVATLAYRIKGYSGNRTSQIAVNVPDSISSANIIGYARELAPVIDGVIDGYIDGVSATIGVALPGGLRQNALPGSDLEHGAEFLFKPRGRSNRVPAFNTAFFLYGGHPDEIPIDTAAPAVAALMVALLDGLDATPSGGDSVVVPVDSRGEESIEYEWVVGSTKTYKK